MSEIEKLLEDIFKNQKLISAVLSNLRKKNESSYTKVDIKPVIIKNQLKYQFVFNYTNKVLHKNLDINEAIKETVSLIESTFKQAMIFCNDADYQVLISKKGKVSILRKKPSKDKVDYSHNRSKNYILEDGRKVDFLIRLGVMNENGKVVAKRYDKFKQINRFLEMVADVIPRLEKNRKINIVDFGCGKSYLTFALYYYLVKVQNLDVNIIGLDLKMDVINFCNDVAEELGYSNLQFIHGDIKDFKSLDNVDMIVTLHACDNATDAALIKAINWGAEVILSVPCCQHEFYDKIENRVLEPMLKHGIIKEKLSSLVTDSLRANFLEILGYQVQLLEFIDMEHTPKNILIRAIKAGNVDREKAIKEYKDFKKFWNLTDLYIEKKLGKGFIEE